jgi:2-hydroxychromene-2-carboxylate isomerase
MPTSLDVHCFFDPLDPRGWGSEPAVRWLRAAHPDATWQYHAVPLLDSWDRYDGPEFPAGRESAAAVCARVSEDSGMPIDEFLWFEDAPSTSHPACRAVAAAFGTGTDAGRRLLRAARESTFIRRTNLDSPEAVRTLADAVDGVDSDAVATAVSASTATIEDPPFEPTAVAGVEAAGDRPKLPALVLDGPDGRRGFSGLLDVAQLRHVLQTVGVPANTPEWTVDDAITTFSAEGWIALAELTALAGCSDDDAAVAARDSADVVEREFAAEPFFRADEFVDEAEPIEDDDSAAASNSSTAAGSSR